jgi:predicted alpha/beta superfamily hydrolase
VQRIESLALPVTIDPDVTPPALWCLPDVEGPGDARRDIYVATPAGHGDDPLRRHPVVYFQDGQNLFDPARSFAGHWGLLETLALQANGYTPVLVGVPNLGPDRLREYSPFDDVLHGKGDGDEYLAFLRGVVKPLVDANFLTRPERGFTTIAGSSMGGLFSLYALIAGAGTFGSAWVLSPALWYADGAIFEWLAHQPGPVGRLWLDVGVEEGIDEVHDVQRMRDLLVARGWQEGNQLRYLEDPLGDHDEASWGRRIRENWDTLARVASLAGRGAGHDSARRFPGRRNER